MPCSDSCHKLEDDHAENHHEDNRKHKLKQRKHIAHPFFILRRMITLSTKQTTITKALSFCLNSTIPESNTKYRNPVGFRPFLLSLRTQKDL